MAAFWVLLFLGLNGANIFERFADAEQNRSVDYLPEKAESVKLLEQIDEFPSGERFSAVVVYRRDGGLTAADRGAIARTGRAGRRRHRRAPAAAGDLGGRDDRAERGPVRDHGRGGHRHPGRRRRP